MCLIRYGALFERTKTVERSWVCVRDGLERTWGAQKLSSAVESDQGHFPSGTVYSGQFWAHISACAGLNGLSTVKEYFSLVPQLEPNICSWELWQYRQIVRIKFRSVAGNTLTLPTRFDHQKPREHFQACTCGSLCNLKA